MWSSSFGTRWPGGLCRHPPKSLNPGFARWPNRCWSRDERELWGRFFFLICVMIYRLLSAFGSSSRKDELTPVGPQTGLIPFCGIASSAEICFIRNVGMDLSLRWWRRRECFLLPLSFRLSVRAVWSWFKQDFIADFEMNCNAQNCAEYAWTHSQYITTT